MIDKKFYYIEESLTINGIKVAQYETYRFTEERIHNVTTLAHNWQELVQMAIDPEFERMNLTVSPPGFLKRYYLKSQNTGDKFYKHQFKNFVYKKTVKVTTWTGIEPSLLIDLMPRREYLFLQNMLLSVLWYIVIDRRCSQEALDFIRIPAFEEPAVMLTPEELESFKESMRKNISPEVLAEWQRKYGVLE